MFGSETWTLMKKDTERMEAQQMKFLRPLVCASSRNHLYVYVGIGRNKYGK
jgi:hypothetical protein